MEHLHSTDRDRGVETRRGAGAVDTGALRGGHTQYDSTHPYITTHKNMCPKAIIPHISGTGCVFGGMHISLVEELADDLRLCCPEVLV